MDLRRTDNIITAFFNEKNEEIDITTFSDANIFLDHLDNIITNQYDLYFLDIIMQRNGISVAEEIVRKFPNATIIFTTSSKEFAFDAFKVKAFDYLIKPLDKNLVYKTLELFLENFNTKKFVWKVKTPNYEMITIELKDILYIESCNRRLEIHLDKDVIQTVSLRSKFLDSIPFDIDKNSFLMCHTSFIVNMNKIKGFNDLNFLMKNGEKVPISKRMTKQVKQKYIDYLVGDVNGNN